MSKFFASPGYTSHQALTNYSRDLPLDNIEELSDVFTTYRKTVEPLRNHPRPVLPIPKKGELPKYPSESSIPSQYSPFAVPTTLETTKEALLKPLDAQDLVKNPPRYPEGAKSAHPFQGGESHALDRLEHLITSGSITTYQETRNGLVGEDFSTKLSAFLSLGCITSRQIHSALIGFEDGTNPDYTSIKGYGKGEEKGTYSIRFELLWRDYMRLCTRKFGSKLFRLSGFKSSSDERWRTPSQPRGASSEEIRDQIERCLNGTTGMGIIDASLRELYHTGYTSNRARQNVASFFTKHLKLDWRIGAEWYESMLVDYDLSSNWGNWQYLAGVGNDPRGEARIFNPVKQSFDYDSQGEYVKMWVEETRSLSEPSEIFQPWTVDEDRREALGLKGLIGVEKPLLRIDFTVSRRGRHLGRPRGDRGQGDDSRGGSSPRGGRGGGSSDRGGRGGYRGYGGRGHSTRGGRGFYNSSGSREHRRMGLMDRETHVVEYAQAQD
jgi:deoxyribodipyrimidine photo-lyase